MASPNLKVNSQFGPYTLVKHIGTGGMADIFLARTQGVAGFEKQLALKVIQPEFADDATFVQMLVDEARITVGLNHPNIVQTFDLGKIDACYFLSMEYVEGGNYFQLLKGLTDRDRDMPIAGALWVLDQVLHGLDYAHTRRDEQGQPLCIIHRDISPQNILLSRFGEVKLVDFGIAKAAHTTHRTRAGVIKGKLVYMSPEQAWGERVDHRSDLFSAGIVLYESLTGGSLYLEPNPVKLLEMVRKAQIPPPSSRRAEIAPELDALVMKALSPLPEHRYQTAREFGEALTGYFYRSGMAFDAGQLGQLVEQALIAESEPPSAEVRMKREDFAVQQEHSIIFSADELLGPISCQSSLAAPQPPDEQQGRRGLLFLLNVEDERPHELGPEFLIGRIGHLRLGDGRVSRRHAHILRQADSYILEDLGSSNGTYLNGDKLAGPQRLQAGDLIRVGPFEMRFMFEEPTMPPPSPIASQQPALVYEESYGTDSSTPLAELEALEQQPSVELHQPELHQPELPLHAADGAHPLKVAPKPPGPAVTINLGEEQLRLPIADRLPLSQLLALDQRPLSLATLTLIRRGPQVWLEPGPGGEGTTHNGQPVEEPIQLVDGDRIQLGALEVIFSA